LHKTSKVAPIAVSAAYRVHQFASAMLARVSPDDLCEADALLPPGAPPLFRRMSVSDQYHSLKVMRTLYRQGHTETDLLAAALLHDAGKSAVPITPLHRTLIVLSRRFAPGLLAWLTRDDPRGWRKPFVIHRRHPEIGALWAAQAGCSALTVSLIRRHQELLNHEPQNKEEEWLAALQRADGAN
jgi:hypothetical protein